MFTLCIMAFLFSCSDEEDKAITTFLEDVKRGAVLRTVEIRNAEFEINDTTSEFNILLEEQDVEDGNLLESVTLNLSFVDMSPENGDQSVASFLFKELMPSDFTNGPENLPRVDVVYTFQELLEASDILLESVRCKDQFRIDLDLNLTDGRVFNTSNSAGTVVNNSGFFKSPFSYLINIVDSIEEENFIGVYQMETIQEGGNGVPFGVSSGLFELTQGHSNNVRIFRHLNENSESIEIEMSVACDIATVTRYQKTLLPTCAIQLDRSDRVLIGPDNPPGQADLLDDSVFELYILEGFEGYSVRCGYANIPSKYRFSKQ